VEPPIPINTSPGSGRNDIYQTIYQPKSLTAGVKIPVLVWSNGGCIGVGTFMMPSLVQVASRGIVGIAKGAPGNITGSFESAMNSPRTTVKALTDAIDWAVANSGKDRYAHMDASRVDVTGQSCGSLEAMTVTGDARVSAVGIPISGSGLIRDKAIFCGLVQAILLPRRLVRYCLPIRMFTESFHGALGLTRNEWR